MIYFVVIGSLVLGSLCPVHADEVEINGPECGIFTTTTLIANGTVAVENQFPWVVFVKIYTRIGLLYKCAGSIITNRHVLTTASCIPVWRCIHEDPIEIDVIYGSNDWRYGKAVKVKKMIRHPNYDDVTLTQDIGVLMVEKPFKFTSNVKPICIPAVRMNNFNDDAEVAGWGSITEDGRSANWLRYTTVNILPSRSCSLALSNYDKRVMYCGYRNGSVLCTGDEGGPLMVRDVVNRYVQVGIASLGFGCDGGHSPDYYTRVDAFTPWLVQVVHSLNSSGSAYSEVPLQVASYTVPQWPFLSFPL